MKIVLACAGGMSTGMLVQKMAAYAQSQGIEAGIAAYGLGELNEVVAGTDVILLGPQIGFQQAEVQQKYPNIPVAVIDMMDYAMMNGEKAFKQAQALMTYYKEGKIMQNSKFNSKLNDLIVKFSNNLVVKTVANGMMLTLPITIVGSLLMVVQMIPYLPEVIAQACTLGTTVTSSFITVYVLLGMTYSMTKELDSIVPASLIISLASFFLVTPVTNFDTGGEKPIVAIQISYLGSKGIFVAMIVALLVTWSFAQLTKKKISFKMPDSVPPFVSKTFEAIIPAAIILVVTIIVSMIFAKTNFGNVHDFIYTMLQTPLEALGNNIWSALFLMFLSELLWWFGIHGSNVTMSILTLLYAAPAYANMEAVTAGGKAENIINLFFLDAYKGPRALALAVVLLFICRSEKFKSIGKFSLIPSIFGITEPMKFGIPQILNPVLFIPLTLAAPLCIVIAYVAYVIGFLPVTSLTVSKNMPTFMTGFMAGGWQGLMVQLIQFVAVIMLYLPFMKRLDQQEIALEMPSEETAV